MKLVPILLIVLCVLACSTRNKSEQTEEIILQPKFTLKDFYSENGVLDEKVNNIISGLSARQQVAQMIIQAAGKLGKPDKEIDQLIKSNSIGGVLLLNGTMEGFQAKVHHFDSVANASGLLPLVYSADAEPSLIWRKIEGSSPVPKTIELKTPEQNREAARTISNDLKQIGILYNYAPVIDISPNNAAIKNRSYGSDPDSVINLAGEFISELQKQGIAATVKHFPGHGLVRGDSHSQLVFIDGVMLEAPLYQSFIDNGAVSIMVGHIAVRNNENYATDGLPASCSRKIVTDLLRNQMGFKGIITTDAMNMGALKTIPNADFLAIQAGNDIVLMPADPEMLVDQILANMKNDPDFENQIHYSVKRIVRMKVCLGIL